MKSNIHFDSSRPLMRLEKGDKVFIEYTKTIYQNEKDQKKYKNVPDGQYEGVYLGDYTIKCEEFPELSGKYNYWLGTRWGSSAKLFASEKPFNKKYQSVTTITENDNNKIFVLIERTENNIALRHYSTKKEPLLTFAKNNTDLTDSEFNKLQNDGVFENDDDEYMIYIDTVTKL